LAALYFSVALEADLERSVLDPRAHTDPDLRDRCGLSGERPFFCRFRRFPAANPVAPGAAVFEN
jgi:hypothetical protein